MKRFLASARPSEFLSVLAVHIVVLGWPLALVIIGLLE